MFKKVTLDLECLEWHQRECKEFSKGLIDRIAKGGSLTRDECRSFMLLALNKRLGVANDVTFGAVFASLDGLYACEPDEPVKSGCM